VGIEQMIGNPDGAKARHQYRRPTGQKAGQRLPERDFRVAALSARTAQKRKRPNQAFLMATARLRDEIPSCNVPPPCF
jgi:hypothetical protein